MAAKTCENASASDDLFEESDERGGRDLSPEIPCQNRSPLSVVLEHNRSPSGNTLPRWCLEKYYPDKVAGTSRRKACDTGSSESDGESIHNTPRRRRNKSRRLSTSPKAMDDSQLYASILEIKSLLGTICKKVEKNERCLKELQEAR